MTPASSGPFKYQRIPVSANTSSKQLGSTNFCVWLEEEVVDVVTTADDASVVLHTHSTKLGYVMVDAVVVEVDVLEAARSGLVDSATKATKIHKTADIPVTRIVGKKSSLELRFVRGGESLNDCWTGNQRPSTA